MCERADTLVWGLGLADSTQVRILEMRNPPAALPLASVSPAACTSALTSADTSKSSSEMVRSKRPVSVAAIDRVADQPG